MWDVFVHKLNEIKYPDKPYHPEQLYPELRNVGYQVELQDKNEVYSAIREILSDMGLDQEHYGTVEWNPFKDWIRAGGKVLLKPNLVYHMHPKGEKEMASMVTNAAILRPVIDYILVATGSKVSITIADAPVQGGDFTKVCEIAGVIELQKFYKNRGIDINVLDMRMVRSVSNKTGILTERIYQRDVGRYCQVNLAEKSELIDVIHNANRFEITDYGFGAVKKHHNRKKNEYFISKEVLEADLFINLPKLKTHRKAGLTCAMKNLVGINGDKTCLAHHTRGTKKNGGDEFSRSSLKKWLKARIWTCLKTNWIGIRIASIIMNVFQKFVWKGKTIKEYNMLHAPDTFSEGSWYGNDTIWRCVKDLNKIIFYADKTGKMHEKKQRNYLCIVDSVLAGEGEGPMEQTTKPFGIVFAGTNPVYVDYVASKLMGYDYEAIPSIVNGFKNRWWNLVDKQAEDVTVYSKDSIDKLSCYFVPAFGWRERLKERKQTETDVG